MVEVESAAFKKRIGERLRYRREYLGLTQEEAGEQLGLSCQFISDIERGVKGISAETLFKICEGFAVSADLLLSGKEENRWKPWVHLAGVDPKFAPLVENIVKSLVKLLSLKNQ